AEGDEVVVRKLLVAQEENLMIQPGAVDGLKGGIVDLAKVDPLDFRAERLVARNDVHRADCIKERNGAAARPIFIAICMSIKDSLKTYRKKRDFKRTTEPAGEPARRRTKQPVFVIQKHDAT